VSGDRELPEFSLSSPHGAQRAATAGARWFLVSREARVTRLPKGERRAGPCRSARCLMTPRAPALSGAGAPAAGRLPSHQPTEASLRPGGCGLRASLPVLGKRTPAVFALFVESRRAAVTRARLPVRRALCLRRRQAWAHQPAAQWRAFSHSAPGRRSLAVGRAGRCLIEQDAQASNSREARSARPHPRVLAGARPPRSAPRTAQPGAWEVRPPAPAEPPCPADTCPGGQRSAADAAGARLLALSGPRPRCPAARPRTRPPAGRLQQQAVDRMPRGAPGALASPWVLAGARPPRTAPRTPYLGLRSTGRLRQQSRPALRTSARADSDQARAQARSRSARRQSRGARRPGPAVCALLPGAAGTPGPVLLSAAVRPGRLPRLRGSGPGWAARMGSFFGARWSGRRRDARLACLMSLQEEWRARARVCFLSERSSLYFFLHEPPPHAALRLPLHQSTSTFPRTRHAGHDRRPLAVARFWTALLGARAA